MRPVAKQLVLPVTRICTGEEECQCQHWGFLVTDSSSTCGEGLSIKQQGHSNQNANMNRSHEAGTGGFSHYISMGEDQKESH